MTSIDDCTIVELPRISQPEGSITPVEGASNLIPFPVRRVFYSYDVIAGAVRGGHAHKDLHQFVVAVMGSFAAMLWDGVQKREIELNRPHRGLYVPPLVWCDFVNFSSGAVSLVLASDEFRESDYLRDHASFLEYRRGIESPEARA